MYSLLQLISTVITLYIWALIISAVLSWLVAFNVINTGTDSSTWWATSCIASRNRH